MLDNYRAWNVTETKLKSLEEKIKNTLEYGILAPSTHNTQPWSIKKNKSSVIITPNFSRSLPKSDKKNRFLYFSVGCLVENILVSAEYLKLDTKVNYQIATDSVTINFSPIRGRKPKFKDHLISAIPERTTYRREFNGTPIDQSIIEDLKKNTNRYAQLSFVNKNENSDIINVLLDASRASISADYFRKELSELVIPNDSKEYFGMPGTVLGFSKPQAVIVPFIMRRFNIAPLMSAKDKAAFNSTEFFGVVGTMKDDKKSWIVAGQTFERMWLQAVKLGLSVQPLASAIVTDHKKTIAKMFRTKYPQMIFRIGYSDGKDIHSPRFPLNVISN